MLKLLSLFCSLLIAFAFSAEISGKIVKVTDGMLAPSVVGDAAFISIGYINISYRT